MSRFQYENNAFCLSPYFLFATEKISETFGKKTQHIQSVTQWKLRKAFRVLLYQQLPPIKLILMVITVPALFLNRGQIRKWRPINFLADSRWEGNGLEPSLIVDIQTKKLPACEGNCWLEGCGTVRISIKSPKYWSTSLFPVWRQNWAK